MDSTWSLPANARGATGRAHLANTDWEDVSLFRDFLPQPFRLIDQLLNELVDDSFELAHTRTAGEREARRIREAEAAIPLAAAENRFTSAPEQTELVNSASVICPLYDSLLLVGSARGSTGRVVLLDTLDPSITVPLLELEPGFEAVCIASVAPPPARAFTLLAIVQRAREGAARDRLLVYQLAIVSLVEETGSSWRPILLSSAELGIRATGLQLSHDGRFAAVLGLRAPEPAAPIAPAAPAAGSGASRRAHGAAVPAAAAAAGAEQLAGAQAGVQVFAVPEAAVAETLAQAAALAAGSGSAEAALILDLAAPAPPPALAAAPALGQRVAEAAAAAPEGGAAPVAQPAAVSCHFVTAPRHRAVGQPLVFSCAGLYLCAAGCDEAHYYQLLAHAPPAVPRPARPDRRCALYPSPITASALNGSTTLLGLGYADGSVGLFETALHVQRCELAPHGSGAPVRAVAVERSARLLSADAAGWLHVYDISAEPQRGRGRLAVRKAPLLSCAQLGWAGLCSCLPLTLALRADGRELHVLDEAGERIGRVAAPDGFAFAAERASGGNGGGGSVCSLLGDEQIVLLAGAQPQPATGELLGAQEGRAAPAADADGAAAVAAVAPAMPAAKPAQAGAGGASKEGAAAGAPAPPPPAPPSVPAAAILVVVDLLDAVLAFYPPLRSRLGGSVSAEQLAQVLRTYSHEQRRDESAMPHPLLLHDEERKGGGSVASRSHAGSRAGSRSGSSAGGGGGGGGGAKGGRGRRGTVAPGAMRKAAAAAVAVAKLGASASDSPSASFPRSAGGACSASAGGSFVAQEARSDGRGSSVGSTGSGIASKGHLAEQEYNDAAARVAKLLSARHYTRFAREARANRRMDELVVIAAGGVPTPNSSSVAPARAATTTKVAARTGPRAK